MKLKLHRHYLGDSYTIGKLYIDDAYFCDTLEDKNRDINKNGKFDNKEEKIFSETCIPFGHYKFILTYSPKFNRELPLLLDVPEFTGIRIHKGRTKDHTSGCIIVGENTIKGQVLNADKYEKILIEKIKEAIKNKEELTINII